ncbi:uncharacterized protein LOC119405678 [Rhipicephalus sanguineus]|uniref:uncharacterized protein LOC119405678 n=1 Tax=Rhipicephalus sanguineus TaxID=34632 RepID=UPI001893AFF8|nr:uncharacterized protein LOC119405678 [Rhipicephalus sanguineus]
MTQDLFTSWLCKFDEDMVAEKRRVILILDNCTAHNVKPKLTAVNLKFLPANTTAKSQPLDQGVIATVKALYKKRICERVLLSMQQQQPLKVNLRGAIDMVVASWWKVKADTISKCFKRAGFVRNAETLEDDEQSDTSLADETLNTDDVWSGLVDSNFVTATDTFQEFVDAGESELPVCEEASTDDAIVAAVRGSAEVTTDDESDGEDEVDPTPEPDFPCKDALEYLAKVKTRRQRFVNLPKPDWDHIVLVPFQKHIYNEHPSTANRPPEEVDAFRRDEKIIVQGRDVPNPILKLEEATFPHFVHKAIREQNYETVTGIHAYIWPISLSGRDLLAIVETGSGMTVGYVIPVILHIHEQPCLQRREGPIALVLAPTHDRAQRVEHVASAFAKYARVRMTSVFEGSALSDVEGYDICIATPGRFLEILEAGKVTLHRCSYLVVDEADRMLEMGLDQHLRKIVEQIRPDRQMLMWSTCSSNEVRSLADDLLTDYIEIMMTRLVGEAFFLSQA